MQRYKQEDRNLRTKSIFKQNFKNNRCSEKIQSTSKSSVSKQIYQWEFRALLYTPKFEGIHVKKPSEYRSHSHKSRNSSTRGDLLSFTKRVYKI